MDAEGWSWRRAAARWRRADALDPLSDRVAELEEALRAADERFVNLAVHSTERTNELTARVLEAEQRVAALEITVHRTVEDEVADAVAHWRERLRDVGPAGRAAPPDVARVATDVGPLLIPAHDQVMLTFLRQHGTWEPEEADQLRALLRPGMTFVDVGAHVGYMSLLAAAAVGAGGRVHAFEPSPENFGLLEANLAVNGAGNVQAVPAAAWDESGRLALSLCADNTGDHRAYAVAGRDTVEVVALALDDVLPEGAPVDVVKVDAQGTDDIAIKGMERTLARCRPTLVVEFWPQGITERGASPVEVLEYYRGLDYDLSVVGRRGEAGTPASVEAVLDAAESDVTGFCTLMLTPCG